MSYSNYLLPCPLFYPLSFQIYSAYLLFSELTFQQIYFYSVNIHQFDNYLTVTLDFVYSICACQSFSKGLFSVASNLRQQSMASFFMLCLAILYLVAMVSLLLVLFSSCSIVLRLSAMSFRGPNTLEQLNVLDILVMIAFLGRTGMRGQCFTGLNADQLRLVTVASLVNVVCVVGRLVAVTRDWREVIAG